MCHGLALHHALFSGKRNLYYRKARQISRPNRWNHLPCMAPCSCCNLAYGTTQTRLWAVVGKDSTLTGRTDIWLATINLIRDKPLLDLMLGSGYMATWLPTDAPTVEIWQQLHWAVPNAHNAYLDVALQLGLVGLGLLLTIIAVAWHRAQACCKLREFSPRLVLASIHCGSTIGWRCGNWARTKPKPALAASKCFQLQLRIKTSISRQAPPISGSAPP